MTELAMIAYFVCGSAAVWDFINVTNPDYDDPDDIEILKSTFLGLAILFAWPAWVTGRIAVRLFLR